MINNCINHVFAITVLFIKSITDQFTTDHINNLVTVINSNWSVCIYVTGLQYVATNNHCFYCFRSVYL
jgi:hypothetical protein